MSTRMCCAQADALIAGAGKKAELEQAAVALRDQLAALQAHYDELVVAIAGKQAEHDRVREHHEAFLASIGAKLKASRSRAAA